MLFCIKKNEKNVECISATKYNISVHLAAYPFKCCCGYKIVKKEGFHMRSRNHGSQQRNWLLQPLIHPGPNDIKRTWKKIMQITNVNKNDQTWKAYR